MRILALDVGEKRIGVAISDPLNVVAQALEVIRRAGNKDVIARVKALVSEYTVSKIVVGMPFNMNGSKGKSAESVEKLIAVIKKEIPVSIETIDERLTTVQGQRILLEADISRKKRKSSIDKIAAQLILQTYMDSHV